VPATFVQAEWPDKESWKVAEDRSNEKAAQVVCPACGHRFGLDEKVVDHYRRDWERTLRQTVRNELRAESAQEIQKQAQRIATKELREKDEEVREGQRQIASLRRQVTNLSKKLPAGRAQTLGDVRQDTLAQSLVSRCPQDEILAVSKGVKGADIVQSVRDPSLRVCGTILWESKRAATWNNGWVGKLREDQRRGDHTVAVIVSETLPNPDRSVIEIDGIWVTTLEVAPDLAAILRDTVIQVASARGARARRDDLKGLAYDYLSGPEFTVRVRTMLENARAMRDTLDLERRALQARWSERERQIDGFVDEVAGIYGDLRGLGTALPTIELLELPAPLPDASLPPAA
jgi:hypothetical protein